MKKTSIKPEATVVNFNYTDNVVASGNGCPGWGWGWGGHKPHRP